MIIKDTNLKKEIYESELKKLTDESAELSKSMNIANTEIESLVESQTALENQLDVVKQEMMVCYNFLFMVIMVTQIFKSLANQLEKKYEQETKRNEKKEDVNEVPPPTGRKFLENSDIKNIKNFKIVIFKNSFKYYHLIL